MNSAIGILGHGLTDVAAGLARLEPGALKREPLGGNALRRLDLGILGAFVSTSRRPLALDTNVQWKPAAADVTLGVARSASAAGGTAAASTPVT
jgi:hypothetical protein